MKSADTLDTEPVPRHVAGANRAARVQRAAASARHGWSARQALPERLIISQRGPVTRLRMSRAAKRNALDGAMIAGLERCFRAPPEGTRGIVVGGGGSVRLPRLIGTARMMDMMLTGRTYGAEEGAPLGFSPYVVADGQGLVKGIELAERMATNAVLSNFAIVQALPRMARADPETGLLMESLMAAIAVSDDEAKARLKTFLEKRASKVTHRADAEPAPSTRAASTGA